MIINTASDDEEIPDVTEDEEDNEKDRIGKGTTEEANNNSIKTSNNNSSADLAALTAACGEKLLNPNFLTGGEEQPFTTNEIKKEDEAVTEVVKQEDDVKSVPVIKETEVKEEDLEPKRPEIKLYSQKMKGLRNLLLAEKLNTQAILLQMTAQSQVGAGKRESRGWNATEGGGKEDGGAGGQGSGSAGGNTGGGTVGTAGDENVTSSGRPKRARRE